MPGGGGCRNRHGGQPQRDHAAGLTLRVRARRAGARVVIYAAGPHAAVAAHFAGAYALVDRRADPRVLVEAVVAAGGGERRLPLLSAAIRRRAAAAIEPADRAILAMRLAGTARAETAETAQMTVSQLDGRSASILAALAGRTRMEGSSLAHVA